MQLEEANKSQAEREESAALRGRMATIKNNYEGMDRENFFMWIQDTYVPEDKRAALPQGLNEFEYAKWIT